MPAAAGDHGRRRNIARAANSRDMPDTTSSLRIKASEQNSAAAPTGGWRGLVPLRHVGRAFQHRNYRLYFAGQLLSLMGTWIQSVAQSWLIYQLTGSALLLGAVNFAQQAPMLLLAPLAGALADRLDRRRLIVMTQACLMVLAFTLAGLTLSGLVTVWHIVVLAGLQGAVNAFDMSARQSFVIEMVGRDDMPNAIALNSTMFNGARMVGPAVGGALVALVGEGWCFLVNGISFLAVLVGLLRMTPMRTARRTREDRGGIATGLAFAARTEPFRSLLLLVALVSLAGMPFTVLLPVFAADVLDAGPEGYGLLMGAIGIGALAGALRLAAQGDGRRLQLAPALATGGFGIALMLFAQAPWFWLAAACLLAVGFGLITETAGTNTLLQSQVPDELRGRIMACYLMCFQGLAPFGALAAGAAAHHLGAPLTVTLGGALCLLGAVAFQARRRHIFSQSAPARRGDA
jgi:MFS family permease